MATRQRSREGNSFFPLPPAMNVRPSEPLEVPPRGGEAAASLGADSSPSPSQSRSHWRAAARHAVEAAHASAEKPPFVDLARPTEIVLRFDYDAAKRTWTESQTVCKMAEEPFANGAMRECFRMLKQTQAPNSTEAYKADWRHASPYVAKRYKDPQRGTKAVFARDVVMQMEAKAWGARFDECKPPKQVDFLQAFLIQLPERPDKPLFACERVIEGEYVKHNNNSGFVEEHHRSTPQAFSHFTFQSSSGRLMIIDIQGVGDLFTDPQIHTEDGMDYGEGNLGSHGMALFFNGHECDALCQALHLCPFPLGPQDAELRRRVASASPGGGSLGASSGSSLSPAASLATTALRRRGSMVSAPPGGRSPSVTGQLFASVLRGMHALFSGATVSSSSSIEPPSFSKQPDLVVHPDELPVFLREELHAEDWATHGSGAGALAAERAAAEAAPRLPMPSPTTRHVGSPPSLPPAAEVSALSRFGSSTYGVLPTSSSLSTAGLGRVLAANAPTHLAMAKAYARGSLPGQDSQPSGGGAVWHLAHAARGGSAEALRALRCLLQGVSQDVLPGVRLESELPAAAGLLLGALAATGDKAALSEVAAVAEADGRHADAVAALQTALASQAPLSRGVSGFQGPDTLKTASMLDLANVEEADEEGDAGAAGSSEEARAETEAELVGLARWQLLDRLARSQKALGLHKEAGTSYATAAELASALGKGKASMLLSQKSEEEWALCPEQEREEEED